MENVQPALGSPLAYGLALLAAVGFVFYACRHIYRYFVFRSIDKHGFQDPEHQALHLRSMEAEKGRFFTRTRRQGVYAIVWVLGAAFAIWMLLSVNHLGSLHGH